MAIWLLGARGRPLPSESSILDESLGPICSIILITGAGGMFGFVLRTSGIGEALTSSLSEVGLPLILQAFLIATALRVAQGSATVALTTTAGLIAARGRRRLALGRAVALLVMAIAAGATVLSHVNDSGFWLVSRFFGMDEATTLKTWTVMETTLGLTAFVIASCCGWSHDRARRGHGSRRHRQVGGRRRVAEALGVRRGRRAPSAGEHRQDVVRGAAHRRGPLAVARSWRAAREDHRGRTSVLACSALRRVYRDRLRGGSPRGRVLRPPARIAELPRGGCSRGHFMPVSLLDSQFATLEPLEPDEHGAVVDIAPPVEEVVASVDQPL